MDHLPQDLEGDRGDVGAGQRRIRHVAGMADRGRDDLGVVARGG